MFQIIFKPYQCALSIYCITSNTTCSKRVVHRERAFYQNKAGLLPPSKPKTSVRSIIEVFIISKSSYATSYAKSMNFYENYECQPQTRS